MNSENVCPVCGESTLYQYKQDIQYSGVGEELLPKPGKGEFSVAEVRPVVCASCGDVRLIASGEVLKRMQTSEHWERLNTGYNKEGTHG